MNAKLEITILNTPIFIELGTVMVEQFSDGIMIHTDKGHITIYNDDIESMTMSDEQDCFIMKNDSRIVLKWE